jgi:predicted amidophosphoribosyltransferase
LEILAHKNLAQLSHLAGKGRLKRFEFLRSALVAMPELLQPEVHYLLVDDVLTTGATLQAAASALHNVGANSVSAVTLAGIEFM